MHKLKVDVIHTCSFKQLGEITSTNDYLSNALPDYENIKENKEKMII